MAKADELRALAERLDAACCVDGKPTGRHMIECHRTLATHFGKLEDDPEALELAGLADLNARCLENELALFNALAALASEAAAVLRAVAMSNEPDAAALPEPPQ